VYANSQKDMQKQADHAARTAAWMVADPPHESIPEGSHIIIERVETL
jgi:hypothetical protein